MAWFNFWKRDEDSKEQIIDMNERDSSLGIDEKTSKELDKLYTLIIEKIMINNLQDKIKIDQKIFKTQLADLHKQSLGSNLQIDVIKEAVTGILGEIESLKQRTKTPVPELRYWGLLTNNVPGCPKCTNSLIRTGRIDGDNWITHSFLCLNCNYITEASYKRFRMGKEVSWKETRTPHFGLTKESGDHN